MNADTELTENLYSYCGVNPIGRVDDDGFAWYDAINDWIKQTASSAWDWTKQTAASIWDWAMNKGSRLFSWFVNLIGIKEMKIIKSAGTVIYNLKKTSVSFAKEMTVTTLLPGFGYGAALGFAAKTGYHVGNAGKNLEEIMRIILFE